MRVVQVVGSISAGYGGLAHSTIGLSEGLSRLGCDVAVCTTDIARVFGPTVAVDRSLVRVHTVPCRAWPRLRLFVPRRFRARVSGLARRADVFHSHGVWQFLNHHASEAAREAGIAHVISPRGAFSEWALGRSAWKKAVAGRLYVGRDLRQAACFHALTAGEARDIRAYGLRNPIAVIPNAVDLAPFASLPGRSSAWRRWPELRDKSVVLFLGRIHPIKGLANLIEAWRRVAPGCRRWHLVVAGPDESGQVRQLRAAVEEAGLQSCVTFAGLVAGDAKLGLLAAADVFCLPSFTEGFSMALLEALACRLPILITDRCHFDRARPDGCGCVVEPSPGGIERGLRQLLGLPSEALRRMGVRGRSIVEKEYTWRHVAGTMLAVYRWLLGRGDRPDVVQLP